MPDSLCRSARAAPGSHACRCTRVWRRPLILSSLILVFFFGTLIPGLAIPSRDDAVKGGSACALSLTAKESRDGVFSTGPSRGEPVISESCSVLNPVERWSEVLFGLIMTLSFTGTLSVISDGQEEVTTMLLSVLGCNIAWGLIDAVLYVMGSLSGRGRNLTLYKTVRTSSDPEQARGLITEALPPLIASQMQPAEIESLRLRLSSLPEPPSRVRISREEYKGAIGVFLLVFSSCIPVIIPFLLIQDPWHALRLSNGIAIAMLFLGGQMLARYAGFRPIWTGLVMVALGLLMVSITIGLGG